MRAFYAGMEILAPAKINLSLRVLGQRADGFHEIETLMAGVGLYDRLDVRLGPPGPGRVECDTEGVPTGPENLVMKAAAAFFQATGIEGSALVRLEKHIPHGAGLGGGSSDAAATLVALNALCGTGLSVEALERIAATFGSDTAWFVRARPAWCRGRGEVLAEAAPLPCARVLLLKPPFGVPTPWAYRAWGEMGGPAGGTRELGWVSLRNDLEPPVFRKYLLLGALKEWLESREGVVGALMSGSGSTVFAVLGDEAEGGDLVAAARARFGGTLFARVVGVVSEFDGRP